MTAKHGTDIRNARLRKLAADISALADTPDNVERLTKARDINEVAQSILWAVVGAETADMIYLEGRTQRDISEAITRFRGEPLSYMGVKHWLDRFGPVSYWLIRKADGGGFETYEYRLRATNVVQAGVVKHRNILAELVDHGGYRVIPAAWLIEDPAAELDLEAAWRELNRPRAARDAFAQR